MRNRLHAWTLAAVVAALASPALGGETKKESWEWSGRVAAGQAIEIKGINGGIDASGSSGDQVMVTAVKKGRRSDPASVEIEVVEHDGGVTICAVYPGTGSRPNECRPGEGGRMTTTTTTTTT